MAKNAIIYIILLKRNKLKGGIKRWPKIKIRIKTRRRKKTRRKISSNLPVNTHTKTGLFCHFHKRTTSFSTAGGS
jgi:hypothetical protein